ncbi:MAG: bifunctional 4-hydroxy-2-oxoglutarate aldolase/2-dehydro-3-deoxy-phosphogluconate aldolase [Thermanaerothrix sp.]|jgi:2-dehydro-3-deoxyphosphogluconate aldolase/(4S)-4-hydroxy-2-oxoglutarate aldolase|uniref:Bifunctional 4-hydroxy-2-oxoglutarate aldolase/2-dehydro-3-deoxy-phosphogluconate aldolase n=1 Tax=Thermanaerothrix solaris TaxID=3058434 RepID=A0ABU3NJM7_9CHLR|nr:bifunctional 4-hydroxy-2-oxoglutarate aldolase/2-dehydro-3-deoxy-phosphogluconate aldolase [Thermanaerothrix sp. 4228-RoL]MDT8897052.1 bifunctional 4-hydroxy-2-oxoglutarate aldolase/2-dehydro-3-deoxy-phosphogluconate aldolase [Thermanaerothrix sp. 4228-RoL]
MNALQSLQKILSGGVIAIMRAPSATQLLDAAKAIYEGGVNIIEVTMTTPGALNVVEQAVSQFGDRVLFGAGSVLDPETARLAILAGAQFVVSPTLNLETIEMCKRYAVPVIPGAFTPTEILTAWEHGADIVKVFPASVGGPAYIKAIKAPLPQIRLAAVGGVTIENTAQFFSAGIDVIGVGAELVNARLLESGAFDEITRRARAFRQEVEKARGR